MKAVRFITACLAFTVWMSAQAAVELPKHAFKKTYDQMLAELPNVSSQLTESDVDGLKRWVGTVPMGTASTVVQISGKDKNSITALTVMLLSSPSTTDLDYENAEALRDVLFQGLLGRGAGFDVVNDFFVQELDRQQPILRAGGVPKRGVKRIAKVEISLELSRPPQGLMAIYAMKLL
ncbi:hypothetical protein [Pseudomonas chlororaphis]|uniref:hypothetical protein n=1 Tax=Pseudomonas chlororaphis TaxID=587753 RepID=UPI000F580A84|nr:hypothetical protein [Pseudomonas chlororaphis]MBP5056363.1 hypothetical protein [Pseudomonas chlororaphis]MBP5139647.1 hypothetical protein [Pseudomonas chlororaphis]QTT98481.1 hypothetical protein HUT26_04060 [Pseudomonas chlororaphis]